MGRDGVIIMQMLVDEKKKRNNVKSIVFVHQLIAMMKLLKTTHFEKKRCGCFFSCTYDKVALERTPISGGRFSPQKYVCICGLMTKWVIN